MKKKSILQRMNGKSNQDMQEIINIMNLLQSIFKEVDDFVKQIVLDNFTEDITMNLSSKVGMRGSQIAAIEIYNAETNTQVIYDMTIFDLLQFCMSKTLEGLLNEKVVQMVSKSMSKKKSDSVQIVYLENSIL